MNELARIDLNLVPALDALLHERNVSRAARRLGMSQPAASNALARLRRHFNDELLVRTGNAYTLTPLAQQLVPLAAQAARANQDVVRPTQPFDASTSQRLFSIAASEYGQFVVGPGLVSEVHGLAPSIGIEFVSPFTSRSDEDADVLDRVDGWLAPKEVMSGPPNVGDVADRWVLVVDQSLAQTGDEIDLSGRDWVAPTVRGRTMNLQLDTLRANGVVPQTLVSTESFAAVPFLVAGTGRVGLVQGAIAHRLASAAGVRVIAFPYPLPPLHLTMWWAPDRRGDPAHQWLRERVSNAMQSAAH